MQRNEIATSASGEQLFETFFAREYATLVRLMFALTGDLGEAEELAQEAMSRVFERWDRVRSADSPAAYTYQVALNLQRKRIRHLTMRARRLPLIRPTPPLGPHVPGELVSALASVPLDQRVALLLTEWLGMSSEEAGSVLGVSGAAVRTRVHRARDHLRSSLEDNDE